MLFTVLIAGRRPLSVRAPAGQTSRADRGDIAYLSTVCLVIGKWLIPARHHFHLSRIASAMKRVLTWHRAAAPGYLFTVRAQTNRAVGMRRDRRYNLSFARQSARAPYIRSEESWRSGVKSAVKGPRSDERSLMRTTSGRGVSSRTCRPSGRSSTAPRVACVSARGACAAAR